MSSPWHARPAQHELPGFATMWFMDVLLASRHAWYTTNARDLRGAVFCESGRPESEMGELQEQQHPREVAVG